MNRGTTQVLGLNFMKRAALIFIVCLCTCSLTHGRDIPLSLKIGIHPHEPFVFIDSANKGTGLFVDIIEYAASKEGWAIEYVPGTLDHCLSKLETNEIDMICALGFSETMDRYYDFNGESLVTDWGHGLQSDGIDIPSLYFAVLQGTHKELLATLDYHIKILKSTPDSLYYQSVKKWLEPVFHNHPFPLWLRWSLVCGLAVLLLLFLGTLVLRFQVQAKNRELVLELNQRKMTEEALQESEERYRTFFEENISGSYIATPEGEVLACNREYKRIFQFATTQEALETPLGSLFEDPKERNDFLIRLKKEKCIIGYEPRLKKVGGRAVHITVNVSGVFDLQGNLERIRGFVLDVSEQRRLEAQLRQAQKMETIGTLAGGIAHDFNNILFPVLGHTEILLQDVPETNPIHDRLKKIYAGGIRARDLVRQILIFSRQDTNELKQIQIQPIIEEALAFVRASIPATIDIRKDISPDCGVVMANPTQIHQIIMNLVTNASHAMEESGGQIEVGLKQMALERDMLGNSGLKPGPYLCLSVSDTGKGMDEAVIRKIFDPFFTTKGKGQGTGMGLSVVHGIVQNMGGVIQALSQPDQGALFQVFLPLAQNALEASKPQVRNPIQGGIEKILLVDDEQEILALETQMLEPLGYQVYPVQSSLEALAVFRSDPARFDLVITDMAMPQMAGDKLAGQLLSLRPDIPILICTGFSRTLSREKANALGIKGFLMKPVSMGELNEKIREILDTKRS